MILREITDPERYRAIVDEYGARGCLSNDYIQASAGELISEHRLMEYCGERNAFLFVKKDCGLRMYYYINDPEEKVSFTMEDDLVTEIIFRASMGLPQREREYLCACGWSDHLVRDQYSAMYRDVSEVSTNSTVAVRNAVNTNEVAWACELFNSTFDALSGDYISPFQYDSLLQNGQILIAKGSEGNLLGALHQSLERGVAWISHVAVLPEARRQHVGQTLLDAFIKENHHNDRSRYMLWVQRQNDSAVDMYKKKGFKYMNKSTFSMIKYK